VDNPQPAHVRRTRPPMGKRFTLCPDPRFISGGDMKALDFSRQCGAAARTGLSIGNKRITQRSVPSSSWPSPTPLVSLLCPSSRECSPARRSVRCDAREGRAGRQRTHETENVSKTRPFCMSRDRRMKTSSIPSHRNPKAIVQSKPNHPPMRMDEKD